jgi:hypothetical protein
MVALIGMTPVFVAVKTGMSPVPAEGRPMVALSLVQVKLVPGPTGLETAVNDAVTLLQKVWFAMGLTVGVGFTVIEYVNGVPMQALAVGVIVMAAFIGEIPLLVAVNAGMFPVPVAARPMAVLVLDHVNVAPPPAGLETVVTGTPVVLHHAWSGIMLTVGEGFTVMV